MRKTIMIALAVLFAAVWLAAQTYSGAGVASDSPSTQTSPSIEGCLNGAAGIYTLTDHVGNGYRLSGDTSQLSKHVGEEVRIYGTLAANTVVPTSPSPATTQSSTNNTGAGMANETTSLIGTFDVTDLDRIARSCSAGATK